MLRTAALGLAAVIGFGIAAPAFAEGDPENGAKVFRKCQACHKVAENYRGVGPTLYNVVGRTAGTVEGYRYSKAMVEFGKEWTLEELDAYLENPRKHVKGTKMAFAGLRNAQERADVIAYIIAESSQ